MQDKTKELVKWSQDNKVLINCNKTREMILGKAKLDNIPRLQINGNQIERVSDFKILGLQLQTTYIGIAMLNSYTTKFHLSYIFPQTRFSNVLVYLQTIFYRVRDAMYLGNGVR